MSVSRNFLMAHSFAGGVGTINSEPMPTSFRYLPKWSNHRFGMVIVRIDYFVFGTEAGYGFLLDR